MLERYLAERTRLEVDRRPSRQSEPMPELLEEVERLPERYRGPDRALLTWKASRTSRPRGPWVARSGPSQTRLQRGKARLRDRLVRRGLAPVAGLLAMGVESAEAATAVVSGSVPAALSESTARAAVQFAASRAAGLATTAIGLAQGVLSSLFWNRLRKSAGLVTVLFMGVALTVLRLAGGRPEVGEARVTDRRASPRRPGPARPGRRRVDAGRGGTTSPTPRPTRRPTRRGTTS